MVLLHTSPSLRVGVADPMNARTKAAEAAADKDLPPPPGEAAPDMLPPPQYEEFVPGSSGDGGARPRENDDDEDTISSVSSLAITVIPPTGSDASSVASPQSARPRWSSPGTVPILRSSYTAPSSPSPLRSDSEPSTSEFGEAPPTIRTTASMYGMSRHSLGTAPLSSAAASSVTLAQSPMPMPSPSTSPLPSPSLSTLAPSIALGQRASVWRPGSFKKATKQARTDIFESLRALIAAPGPNAAAILTELEAHATANKLVLQSLLQESEGAIEDKSAVYWAAAKLGPGATPDAYAAAQAILTVAAPLSAAAQSAVRAAALCAGDQHAWAAVRSWVLPTFWQDALLLSETGQADSMDVVGSPDDDEAFLAAFTIPQFRKRMKLRKRVGVDCFAKGRLFSLTFIEVPAGGLPKRKGQVKDKDKKKKDPELGSWVVSLSLLEPSQETPISARLIIDAVTTPGSGGRAAVDLRIALAKDWKLGAKEESKKKIAEEAVASLRDSLAGRAMEFEDSPYVDHQGSLRGRLYVKLKPDDDQIIR